MKCTHVVIECGALPTVVGNRICPIGGVLSPTKLTNVALGGLSCSWMLGSSFSKQCAYKMLTAAPPSTYIRSTLWFYTVIWMVSGSVNALLASRIGKDISFSLENSWMFPPVHS